MVNPALFGRSEKLRDEARQLRLRAVRLRIEAADIFCNVAENELRWEPPERAREALQKVWNSVAETRRYIEEPDGFDPATSTELDRLLSKIEARAAAIETGLKERQRSPDAAADLSQDAD